MSRPRKGQPCRKCGKHFVWTKEEQIEAVKKAGVDHLLAAHPGSKAIVLMDRLCPECRKEGK